MRNVDAIVYYWYKHIKIDRILNFLLLPKAEYKTAL